MKEKAWAAIFDAESLGVTLSTLRSHNVQLARLPIAIGDPREWLQGLASHQSTNVKIGRLTTDSWTQESASVVFEQLLDMSTKIVTLETGSALTDTLARAFEWESCRAYMVVFRWVTDTGPSMSEDLFLYHEEMGDAIFKENFPQFAPLVLHIRKYISNLWQTKASQRDLTQERTTKKRKKPSQVSSSAAATGAQTSSAVMARDTAMGQVPANLFGLLPDRGTKLIRLTAKHPKELSSDNQVLVAAGVFFDVLSEQVIYTRLSPLDKSQASLRTAKERDAIAGCKNRAIVRGAVLHTIHDVLGEDGVFASGRLGEILRSPSRLFEHHSDKSLAAKILRGPSQAMAGLHEYLESMMEADPEISELCTEIGDQAWENIVLLDKSRCLDRMGPQKIPHKIGRRRNHRGGKLEPVTDIPPPPGPLSADTIAHAPNAPFLGMLGLLLRESLNNRRHKPRGDPRIAAILNGEAVTTGYAVNGRGDQVNLDFFDPVRADNLYARTLKEHLPANAITTRHGFSRLMSYMSAGLGYLNEPFLADTNMQFNSLAECVAAFDKAISKHTQDHPPGSAAFKPYQNMKCWGQPANQFAVNQVLSRKGEPLRFMTTEEKFAPFWAADVQDKWIGLLGDLLDKDPVAYTGQVHSWSTVLKWAIDTKRPFLRSGLTLLQFVNNLALYGICRHPTPDEMSSFISKHGEKGAFRGLNALGFNVDKPNRSEWVRAAFSIVHDHLDEHLSAEDKETLRFGAMFVEHVLCKITRYQYKCRALQRTFTSMGIDAQTKQTGWTRGANKDDTTGLVFPIPLTITTAKMQCLIDRLSSAVSREPCPVLIMQGLIHITELLTNMPCALQPMDIFDSLT